MTPNPAPTLTLTHTLTHEPRVEVLYYFCRLQMPAVLLSVEQCRSHLQRTFQIFQKKNEGAIVWEAYLDNLYPLDWFTASACLEGIEMGPGKARALQALPTAPGCPATAGSKFSGTPSARVSAKWHAEKCPGATSRSTGRSVAQIDWAMKQRG